MWTETHSVYSLLVSAALKSVAILGAASLLAFVLRARSAASRHLAWTAAFAGLVALPFFSAVLPAFRVPVSSAILPATVFQASASTASGAAARETPRPRFSAIPAQPARWRPDWRWSLALLWAAGAGLSLAQMLSGWVALWRVRRVAGPFSGAELDSLTRALGIRKDVEVLQAPPGSMPMAFGVFRPAIFLPADAVEWSADRRHMVLLHELAHVRRGDLVTHLLAKSALSLHWWNPLAWRAWREFLKERERATDDLVLQAGARASDYAGHLLEIARTMQAGPALGWAAVAMARPSQLEGRLLAILDSRVNRTVPGRTAVLVAALLAMGLTAPFAALQAQDRTATLPSDLDAAIRMAASQKNHEMLESAAKAAEVLRQYDVAQKLLESSLAIRAEVSGQGSVEYGIGLLKLGDLERSRGDAQAQVFYTKAAAVLGNRPEAAPALISLGTAALSGKNLDLAVDYFQRAQAADPAHAGTALMWMAVVRERQQSPSEAESLFRSALGVEDPASPQAALTNELYAFFLRRQGREDDATVAQNQALAVRGKLGAQAVTIRRGSSVTAFRVGGRVTAPSLLHKVEPQYTEEARSAKYQGTVVVSVAIAPDGTAQDMRVVRGLGLGLDEEALKAISQWQFKPGMNDGQAVPVQATIEVNFRLL